MRAENTTEDTEASNDARGVQLQEKRHQLMVMCVQQNANPLNAVRSTWVIAHEVVMLLSIAMQTTPSQIRKISDPPRIHYAHQPIPTILFS